MADYFFDTFHVHRLQETAGLGPVTLVSADRDLNTAALAEGLAVDDPTTHS